ncbi:MAG TPA: UvrD-helicase domain-containing protein [Gemmatimonadales bacterium]
MPVTPTPRQRDAIEAALGPVLVVAGPGAGKTFCLIGRIGYLIDTQALAPDRICAVTFTNKAAEEIALRLETTLGTRAEGVTGGTLHGLCVSVLREHGAALQIEKGFGIADEAYQRLVLRRLGVPRKRWGQLLTLFSRRRLQNHQLGEHDAQTFRRYQEYLRTRDLLDFDDLIARTAELFRYHPDLAARVAGQWDYVLVDEFQDLDPAQYEILKALVASHRNFFAVGDDEQSIFSWRGADPKVLQTLASDFGIAAPIVLDQNRRCSIQIFETARRLIAREPSLFDKRLKADRHSEYEVVAHAFADEREETAWLLRDLVADRGAVGLDWGEYAVLYRTHRVGNALEAALVQHGIPCRLARGRALTDDEIVGFVVAALRIMRRPGDPLLVEALAEIVLPRPLVERVRVSMRDDAPFHSALRVFAASRPRSDPDAKKAWRLVYQVASLTAMYRMHTSLTGLIEELLAQRVGAYTNILEELHDELSDPADDPETVRLGARLLTAMRGAEAVRLPCLSGAAIAVRGMLLRAGLTRVEYGGAGTDEGLAEIPANPLRVFKALQFAHASEFGHEFQDFVAFDLETTDLDIRTCEIVEIGAARVRGGEVVEQFHALVRPRARMSAGAQKTHGYDEAALAGERLFEDVWPAFRRFVADDLLVAHNGEAFDVPVLRRMAAGQEGLEQLVFFDSLLLVRSLFRSGGRLEDLALRFGVDTGRAHHALDDAVTLARVFTALGHQKIVRSRKSALVNLLDYLGLGLALDTGSAHDAEATLLKERASYYALGRYSDCLEYYDEERARLGGSGLPTRDDAIELLGGQRTYDRLRASRSAEQRYPEAYARLRGLIDASRGGPMDESVERFLDHVALSTSDGAEVDRHRVNLLTLHSTKGLEFSRVYIVGVEDYQLPGYYQTVDNRVAEIDEARRLLYVGMTRAEDRLVLTRADRRGDRDTGGSRFLEEMALDAVPAQGAVPSPDPD